jgi:hypothetical protein
LTLKRLSKRFLKITGLLVGSLLLLLTIFHFWFVNHAEELLQNMVASKSNGKLRLQVGNFKFNWFSKKMELERAIFYTTDTIDANTAYRFAVRKINLKVKALLPMIFEKRVLINLLSLKDPDIVVTKLRSYEKDTTDKSAEDLSIPREMGRIYKSIQDAINVLQVKKFEIEDARFTLTNRANLSQHPVYISHIDFHIDNLRVDSTDSDVNKKIFFSDNIVLKSRDQVIVFPDGRHKLSYRKFRINIEKKIVELDSCTIAALKTDSSAAAFSIFFDELKLTNIDFDTLYRSEVIKADSVYAVNPRFNLDIELDKRKGKRGAPSLDRIIQQLTGDLQLNFVVVNNASFNINTTRNGKTNSFTSEQNNFEMQGLRIDKEAEKPLKVDKFQMAIRNYKNFLRDSTYEMGFDSVIFNDDRINLSNYVFTQIKNGKKVKQFMVPRFQLIGLSWDELLFENKLKAQQATLYNPVIYYTETNPTERRRNKRNLFQVIADVNEMVMLEDLNIINGDIEANLNDNVRMKLEDATISVESRSLLGSQELSGIRRSVNQLNFSKGHFRFNDVTVLLEKINYTGKQSQLHAKSAIIFNESSTLKAAISDILMDEIYINEHTGDVTINGIKWEKCDIKLDPFASSRKKSESKLSLSNINVKDTRVTSSGNRNFNAFFYRLAASEFLLEPGKRPRLSGLHCEGKDLSFRQGANSLSIGEFIMQDKKQSFFNNLAFNSGDKIDFRTGYMHLEPDIQSVIDGEMRLKNANIIMPIINISAESNESPQQPWSLPLINIDKLYVSSPRISFTNRTVNGEFKFNWISDRTARGYLSFSDLNTSSSALSAGKLKMLMSGFSVTGVNGKQFNAGEGEITTEFENIKLGRNSSGPMSWSAVISSLIAKNFKSDSLGKKNGSLVLESMLVKGLNIGSAMKSFRQILKNNQHFRFQDITGNYADDDHLIDWRNLSYDKNSNMLSLDSLSYSPAMSRDSFVAAHAYQIDYLKYKSGKIAAGPFDLDSYLTDTIIKIGKITVEDVKFSDQRDNRLPFRGGIIKPLMVNRVKSIPVKLTIDSIVFNNAEVTYAEINALTKQEGIVPLKFQFVRIFPVRNFDLSETDSLRIQANAWLFDSIWIRLRLKESYTDSLGGFLMTARIKPADMRILNNILPQFARFKIESGFLDTLNMRVAGSEYLAYGEMNMFYHDLKIRIIPKDGKKKFSTAIMNFIANNFVLKKSNRNRTGNVFFIRNREKSAFNYLVKILVSGLTTSSGAKGNKKIEQAYKKELRKRNLPPLDYD